MALPNDEWQSVELRFDDNGAYRARAERVDGQHALQSATLISLPRRLALTPSYVRQGRETAFQEPYQGPVPTLRTFHGESGVCLPTMTKRVFSPVGPGLPPPFA